MLTLALQRAQGERQQMNTAIKKSMDFQQQLQLDYSTFDRTLQDIQQQYSVALAVSTLLI